MVAIVRVSSIVMMFSFRTSRSSACWICGPTLVLKLGPSSAPAHEELPLADRKLGTLYKVPRYVRGLRSQVRTFVESTTIDIGT